MTSRLVKRILVEVFKPRQGVMKMFKTRDMDQVTVLALWSTLRSLSLALELSNIGFHNLDIVSSELVKFLLVNTGYESIAKLENKVEELEKFKVDCTFYCISNMDSQTKKLQMLETI